MTERNRPEGSFFSRNLTRLGLIVGIAGAGIGGGIGVNKGTDTVREVLARIVPIESFRPCYGKMIPGTEAAAYHTDKVAQVREGPDQGTKLIGEAPIGQSVIAEQHYGMPYIGSSLSSNGLGQIDCPEDEDHTYGRWYLVHELDVEVNGRIVPRYNVYVSGNFLQLDSPDAPNNQQGEGVAVTSQSQ